MIPSNINLQGEGVTSEDHRRPTPATREGSRTSDNERSTDIALLEAHRVAMLMKRFGPQRHHEIGFSWTCAVVLVLELSGGTGD